MCFMGGFTHFSFHHIMYTCDYSCGLEHLLPYVSREGLDHAQTVRSQSSWSVWCSPAVITEVTGGLSLYQGCCAGLIKACDTHPALHTSRPVWPARRSVGEQPTCVNNSLTSWRAHSQVDAGEYYGLSPVDLSSPGDHVTGVGFFSFLSF